MDSRIIRAVLLFAVLLAGRADGASPLFDIKSFEAIFEPLPGKLVLTPVRDSKNPSIIRKVQKTTPPRGLFQSIPDPKNPGKYMRQFVPSIWLEVKAKEKISTTGVSAKVYFYDESKKLIATVPVPTNCLGGLPTFLDSENTCDLFIPIPKELLQKHWNVLAVIGDKYEAAAKLLKGNLYDYSYPERELVARQGTEMVVRHKVVDPVVSLIVKTNNKRIPLMTLFMRPPQGVTDYSEIEGVLCTAVLANSPEQIHQMLLEKENEEFCANFGFADEHKLAIIAWGSPIIWPKNYWDQTPEELRQADRDFDDIADAWERGIKQLGERYGIPMRNYLLWGICGSSYWANRIALRKPDYFLALHLHIPQLFDKPTPEANRVMWLITTGELDTGYQNTIHFFEDAKKLNYPIIHKAIEGMGHARSPITDNLETQFFEYALSLRSARDAYDQACKNPFSSKLDSAGSWMEGFKSPPFYGDIVNQERYSADKVDMIPGPFRAALPTQEIADTWINKLKPASASAAEKRPPNAGENLALNKPYVCSNPHPNKPQRGGLTDGAWNFQFLTGDSPQFPKTVTIDLQKEANVSMVLVGLPWYSAAKTVIISLSLDGKDFADVGSYEFARGIEAQHVYSFSAQPARYVRLIYPNHYGPAFGISTSEVEVYAPEK